MDWTAEHAATLAVGARQQPAVAARLLRAAGDAARVSLADAWERAGLEVGGLPAAHDQARTLLAAAISRGEHVLGWHSADYPARLLDLPDPPLALWIKGDPRALSRPSVAIVGSRAARPASREVAFTLAADLARCGVVVVSGLARGVDAAAHRGALDAGCTVAILGTGLETCYPREHATLAAAIVGAGALVTEFVPGSPPRAHHFPLRNRILSGLVQAVVVVQASSQSGSLITARLALEQGRDVMAVPGDVRDGANRGGHALLRDGARLVENAADVLDELGWGRSRRSVPDSAGAGAAPTNVPANGCDAGAPLPPAVALLRQTGGLALDDLAARLGTTAPILLRDLLDFELAGLITRDGTGRFIPAERKW